MILCDAFSDALSTAGPIAWMVELFGPSEGAEGFEDDYFANAVNSLSSTGDGRKNGSCLHEDGGRFAVFQNTEGHEVRRRQHVTFSFIHSFYLTSLKYTNQAPSISALLLFIYYIYPSILSYHNFFSFFAGIFCFESVPRGL